MTARITHHFPDQDGSFINGIPYAFFTVLTSFTALTYLAYVGRFTTWTLLCLYNLKMHYYRRIVGGVEKAAEETASKRPSAIDLRILDWTLGTLGEDDLLEKFFDSIPGSFNSSLVKVLKPDYAPDLMLKFSSALAGFLHRTDSILDSVKSRRLIICIDAADAMRISDTFFSIPHEVEQEQSNLSHTIETGHALARWCTS